MGAKEVALPAVPAAAGPERAARGGTSFIDRLVAAIARLPFGGWWLYVVLAILVGAWFTIVRWLTGVAPVGQIDFGVLTPVPFALYCVALIQYLNVYAGRAMRVFAPALDSDPDRVEYWRRQLTTLPARPTAIFAIVGSLIGLLILIQSPPSIYELFSRDLVTTNVLVGWVVILGFAANVLLLYHTWHQLRVVRAAHAAATHVDPFRSAPLFAFSGLTARTGLGYLVLLYYSLTINGEFNAREPTLWLSYVPLTFVAVACFVLPLTGMHTRLATAKSDLIAEVETRTRGLTDELFRRIDEGGPTGLAELHDALSSLTIVRDRVVRLPTWPWSTGLFRGFLTAVLLPIAIWFVTWVLGNFLRT
jgi:hypothetical protein